MLSVWNCMLCGCDYALRAVKEKLPPGASQSFLVLGSKNVFHVDVYKKGDGCSTYFHRTGQTGSDSLEQGCLQNPQSQQKGKRWCQDADLLGWAKKKELRLKLATRWSQFSPTTEQWPQIQLQTVWGQLERKHSAHYGVHSMVTGPQTYWAVVGTVWLHGMQEMAMKPIEPMERIKVQQEVWL